MGKKALDYLPTRVTHCAASFGRTDDLLVVAVRVKWIRFRVRQDFNGLLNRFPTDGQVQPLCRPVPCVLHLLCDVERVQQVPHNRKRTPDFCLDLSPPFGDGFFRRLLVIASTQPEHNGQQVAEQCLNVFPPVLDGFFRRGECVANCLERDFQRATNVRNNFAPPFFDVRDKLIPRRRYVNAEHADENAVNPRKCDMLPRPADGAADALHNVRQIRHDRPQTAADGRSQPLEVNLADEVLERLQQRREQLLERAADLLDDVRQHVDDAAQQVRQHVRQPGNERRRRLHHARQDGVDDARQLRSQRGDKRLHRLHEARRHRLQARDDVLLRRRQDGFGQVAHELVNILFAIRQAGEQVLPRRFCRVDRAGDGLFSFCRGRPGNALIVLNDVDGFDDVREILDFVLHAGEL